MTNFVRIAQAVDVAPLAMELQCHPELWNQNTARRDAPDSPHAEMSDIWVRFRDPAEITDSAKHNEPHHSVMYPAWHFLPALRPIVFGMMARCQATALGGILITRIPPGGQIKPHDDRHAWHARHYRTKLYLPIESNADCTNWCDGETLVMQTGEVWFFDNLKPHSVENRGATDRITLIVSLRCE